MNKFFVSILIIMLGCKPIQEISFNDNLLMDDTLKYWDPYYDRGNKIVGQGWLFINESIMKEYIYKEGERFSSTYGDVLMDTINWCLNGDTILLENYFEYKILKLTSDTLEVLDLRRTLGRDTLLFLKSKDQIRKPLPVEYPVYEYVPPLPQAETTR